jgi:hypothetical protein
MGKLHYGSDDNWNFTKKKKKSGLFRGPKKGLGTPGNLFSK